MRSTNTWCYSGDSASASVSRTTKRAPASAPSLCATEPDFDVDQIVGVKNIKLRDPGELAAPAMQSYDPDNVFQWNAAECLHDEGRKGIEDATDDAAADGREQDQGE